jgi:hypothetical protein
VGAADVRIANLVPVGTLSSYVSASGELRVRIRATNGSRSFTAYGNQLQIVYDRP